MDEVSSVTVPARSRRRWRAWAAVGVAVVFALGTTVRLGGLEAGALLVPLVSFTPYFALAALVVLGLVIIARNRVAIAIMLAVCVSLAWCVIPRAVSGTVSATGRSFRVLTANLAGGRGDAGTIVDLARRLNVDVLSLQELTWLERDRLEAAGLAKLLPYQVIEPENWGADGSGVYARLPLREQTGVFQPVGHHMPVVEVALPGGSAVQVVVVHPVAPVPSTVAEWETGVATLPPAAPATGLPRVLAGDFNASLDHAVFRRLLATGYTDAAASTGQGLTPTWGMRKLPLPLVTLDHVLTDSRAGAADVQVYDIPGSDHRAVFADLRVQP